MRRKYEKVRLNIAVKKEAAERAKAAGINISAAFEEYLTIISYEPKPDDYDVVQAYNSFFKKIYKILSWFDIKDITIQIGEVSNRSEESGLNGCQIYINSQGDVATQYPDGKYYIERVPEGSDLLFDVWTVSNFYPPRKILLNLIAEVKKRVATNNVEVQKLNLATKIVSAIFNETSKSNDNGRDKGGGKEQEKASESGSATPHLRRLVESIGQAIEESTQEEILA